MITRAQVGLRAALRALLPVLLAALGLVETGAVKHPRDLLQVGNVVTLLGAAGVKGAISGLTARSVHVEGAPPARPEM